MVPTSSPGGRRPRAASRVVGRRLFGLLTVGIVILVGAAPAGASAVRLGAGVLYVQEVGGGTLREVDGSWHLVLHDPQARTTFFGDRPSRRGGSIPLRSFISDWSRTFGRFPPNAALDIARAPRDGDVALLQLSRPRLRESGKELVFAVRPLKTSTDAALAPLVRRADRGISGSFGDASLFIDDGEEEGSLAITFSGLPTATLTEEAKEDGTVGGTIEVAVPGHELLFSPPASFDAATPTLTFGSTRQVLSIACGIGQTLVPACSGTATLDVAASDDRPLEVFVSPAAEGTVSASWAGGPPVSFRLDEAADYILEPGAR